ncbi:hypothetical protein [Thauera aminoaromatica]|uniref:Uncharacterized protein n=1 Tax=Thauera aminoaromatica TaxID=164330 RepID=A0A5C7SPW2_THASP|nr:hypothetical protein [Thauera aminoaromatica]TXH85589.1 MAG: hypothetical protein E6Q80_09510 [Thauera aminoaromatica]
MNDCGACPFWPLWLPDQVRDDLNSAVEVFMECDESGALWNEAETMAVQCLFLGAEILYATAGRPSVQVITDGLHLFFVMARDDGRPLVFLSESGDSKPIAWPGMGVGDN